MELACVVMATLLLAATLAVSACSGSGTAPNETPTPAATPSAGGSTSPTTEAAPDALTVGVTEGPYYITGTALLKDGNLNATSLPGEPIKVSGTVYSGIGTSKPVPGAMVEIWHADAGGAYHPNANGDASQYSAGELALRGHVLADEKGHYEFTSIYPGYYQGRTRHIHVRASATGFGGVTTQIIVPSKAGDATTPANDMIAQSLPASYKVVFTDNNGVLETTFDFHLGTD